MHAKIGVQIELKQRIYKIISLKIHGLGSKTSAGGKCKATTDAATGGDEIGSLLSHDGKCHPTTAQKLHAN